MNFPPILVIVCRLNMDDNTVFESTLYYVDSSLTKRDIIDHTNFIIKYKYKKPYYIYKIEDNNYIHNKLDLDDIILESETVKNLYNQCYQNWIHNEIPYKRYIYINLLGKKTPSLSNINDID